MSHYFVEIKEWPGCMSDGETLQEALECLGEAVSLWEKTQREDGCEIPVPKTILIIKGE
jgi:antitoxin HicB